MSPEAVGIIGICFMVVMFFSRMQVAYVMILVGGAGFAYLTSTRGGLNLLPRDLYSSFSNYDLSVILLFILMGQIAFVSGISRRLYEAAYLFMGSIRGGLAIASVAACTAFGAICGSSAATAATMATVAFPEMKRYNYSNELVTGSVAAGGGLGMIMPPSVVMIIYGILTENSIGKLFVSGIIPAIVVTCLFAIVIYIWCTIKPEHGPRGEKATWRKKILSLPKLTDAAAVFALVMGGLFTGLFTPTEAASVGAFGVFVIALIRRQLTWKSLFQSLYESIRTGCMAMMLVASALIFGKFFALTRIPFELAGWVGSLDLHPIFIITIIIAVYFVGGCFMDSLAFVALTIPIFYPVATRLGYDPVWFGLIIVMITEMGVITPPVGINVYVVYGMAKNLIGDVPLHIVFKGILPFLAAVVLGTILFMVFPQIVLFLPNLMYGR